MGYPFNQLSFGVDKQGINTVVEIPKGSMLKAEWDRHQEYFVLDRVEPGIFLKPVNYGFIPQTLDEDQDELDTLIVTAEPLPMGLVLTNAQVIGVVNFRDGEEMDHKVVVVPEDDRHYGAIKTIEDLGAVWQQQIEHHFTHYKDLKQPGSTEVLGFGSSEEAWQIITECVSRAAADPWW
jgi:inorganic pyrophosphatase